MFSHTDKKEDTLESGGILKLEWVGWGGLVYTCTTVCCCPLHVSTLAVWLFCLFLNQPRLQSCPASLLYRMGKQVRTWDLPPLHVWDCQSAGDE